MPVLPDGRLQIRNSKTGETKIIKPEEMGQYGVSNVDYLTQLKAMKESQQLMSGASDPTSSSNADAVSGGLPIEQLPADARASAYNELQKRATAPAQASATSQTTQPQTGVQGAVMGKDGEPIFFNQADRTKYETRQELAIRAKAMYDVLNDKNATQTEKEFAASNFAAAKGFGEGGKVLSNAELGILSGAMPKLQQRGYSIFDRAGEFFTGNKPDITSKVVDSDTELKKKALLTLEQYKDYIKKPPVQPSTQIQQPSVQAQPNPSSVDYSQFWEDDGGSQGAPDIIQQRLRDNALGYNALG